MFMHGTLGPPSSLSPRNPKLLQKRGQTTTPSSDLEGPISKARRAVTWGGARGAKAKWPHVERAAFQVLSELHDALSSASCSLHAFSLHSRGTSSGASRRTVAPETWLRYPCQGSSLHNFGPRGGLRNDTGLKKGSALDAKS